MVEAVQEQDFYNIDDGWGSQTKSEMAHYRDGSILTLPMGQGQTKEHKLIACGGPSNSNKCKQFWTKVVLDQEVSLVVNLCRNVNHDLSKQSFSAECSQYWPT